MCQIVEWCCVSDNTVVVRRYVTAVFVPVSIARCSYVEMKRVEPAHPMALLREEKKFNKNATCTLSPLPPGARSFTLFIEAKKVKYSVRLRSDGGGDYIVAFQVMIPCSLVGCNNGSEKRTAFNSNPILKLSNFRAL